MNLSELFAHPQPIIGMIHLLPLPGAPGFQGAVGAIYERARWEADILVHAGVDGLIVENFGDEPYLIGEPDPHQLALMSSVTRQIRAQVEVPIGVNLQYNAWQAELAIAYACQVDFVRVEVFVDTVITAQGMVEPCSAHILRYRKDLHAEDIYLFCDIQAKYTTNLRSKPLVDSASEAVSAGADALIVTGAATGQATPLDQVTEVKSVVDVPVVVGSGTTVENLAAVLATADGAIVGSALKEAGKASNRVSPEAARRFMEKARFEDA